MAVGDPCGCNQYRVAEYEPGRYMFQRLNTIWQQFCEECLAYCDPDNGTVCIVHSGWWETWRDKPLAADDALVLRMFAAKLREEVAQSTSE